MNEGLPLGYRDSVLVQSLAVAPSDATIVYAGTGDRNQYSNGVYKSIDGGQTWMAANQGILDVGITALAVDPKDPDVVFAGTYDGRMYKSVDGGQTLQNITYPEYSNFMNAIYSILIDPNNSQRIVIRDNANGVLISQDGGARWTPLGKPSGNSEPPYGLGPMAVIFDDQPIIFLGSEKTSLWIYTRGDFVEQVTPTSITVAKETLTPLPGNGRWEALPGLPKAVNSVVIDPTNPNVMYVGAGRNGSGAGVFRTVDGGQTFEESMVGLPREDARVLTMDSSGPETRLFAIVGENLYVSENGAESWQKVGDSYGRSFYMGELLISPDGKTMYTWYGGTGLYRSPDGGVNWISASEGLPEGQRGDVHVDSLVVSPMDPQTLYAGTGYNHQLGNGVFKSTDGGQTWVAANKGMLDLNVTALVVDPTDPQKVYAGVDGGGLFLSTDGGQNWVKLRDVGQTFSNWVITLTLDPKTGRLFMVCNQEGIMTSGDGGLHWQVFGRPDPSPGNEIQAFAISFKALPVFYVSTRESGLWQYILIP